jgi:hypothetical protein
MHNRSVHSKEVVQFLCARTMGGCTFRDEKAKGERCRPDHPPAQKYTQLFSFLTEAEKRRTFKFLSLAFSVPKYFNPHTTSAHTAQLLSLDTVNLKTAFREPVRPENSA